MFVQEKDSDPDLINNFETSVGICVPVFAFNLLFQRALAAELANKKMRIGFFELFDQFDETVDVEAACSFLVKEYHDSDLAEQIFSVFGGLDLGMQYAFQCDSVVCRRVFCLVNLGKRSFSQEVVFF